MARANEELVEIPGQDSFLDVITNIVGILILLVLVVGVRTTHSVANSVQGTELPVAEDANAKKEKLGKAYREALVAQDELVDLVTRAATVHRESQIKEDERQWMANFVAAAEKEVNAKREDLSQDQQRNFDLRRQLQGAQQQLDSLAREHMALLAQEPDAEVVENRPTPLAKTVSGQEMYLRLSQGYVAVVPVDELVKECKANIERNIWRVREQGFVEGTVGPINGFRMRYRLWREEVAIPSRMGGNEVYGVPQYRYQFVPVSAELGERLDDALATGSELRAALERYKPQATTVTILTYPDSFAEYRRLKKVLFDLGFATAGRPLAEGMLIESSSGGSKSSAQ